MKKVSRSAKQKRKNYKDIKLSDLAIKPNFKRMDNVIKKHQALSGPQRVKKW
jgi:hypothetical protein